VKLKQSGLLILLDTQLQRGGWRERCFQSGSPTTHHLLSHLRPTPKSVNFQRTL